MHEMTETMRVGGGVVFWSLAAFTDHGKLQDGLGDIGLGQFAPERRQLTACLRDAMDEVCGGPRKLIRPLSKRDGFAVVEETRGEADNEYRQVLTARVEGDENSHRLRIYPSYTSEADKIQAAFSTQKGLLRPAQVAGMLVRIIQFLSGTPLRPNGAIYWLAEESLEKWGEVTQLAERAAIDGKSACYIIRHKLDAEAVRAVRDAIVMEINGQADRLHTEIMSGELGTRALKARKEESEDLRQKVLLYETLLETGLGAVRQNLEKVEEAAAAAVILASGAMEPV